MHKPNIQTVIPPRSAQLVMQVLVLCAFACAELRSNGSLGALDVRLPAQLVLLMFS
jgi:hypothetical protein